MAENSSTGSTRSNRLNPLLHPPPRRGGGKHVLSHVEGRWGCERSLAVEHSKAIERIERRTARLTLSMGRFLRIAHRGASGDYPENTRIAFEKAIEARADMIELDCQLSGDGHVVVFHDERLKRTAGVNGKVQERTLEQLKKLDVGCWRKNAFQGERILTLEEVFQLIPGSTQLCIEIKRYPNSPTGIDLKVLFIVSHYDYLDRTIFSSFDYPTLRRVREMAPEARIGVICGEGTDSDPLGFAEQIRADSIHVQKELVTRELLAKAWDAGRDVYVWTVNHVREMEAFACLGVQGIISDYPAKLWKLRANERTA